MKTLWEIVKVGLFIAGAAVVFVLVLQGTDILYGMINRPGTHSIMQGLERGDKVEVRFGRDTIWAEVFGIDTHDPACVYVIYPDSTRHNLHESYLWRIE